MKKRIGVLAVGAAVMLALCACSSQETASGTASGDAESSAVITDTTEAETTQQNIQIEMPTEQGGTFAESKILVSNFTIFERKADNSVVKQTFKKDLPLTQATFDFAGKKQNGLKGEYRTTREASDVSFELNCIVGDITDVIMGKVYQREDGNAVYEANCIDENGKILPVHIDILFE